MTDAAPRVLQVALPLPLPQTFDYLPPEGLAAEAVPPGVRVRVPFGRGERVGIVLGAAAASAAPDALKPALAVLDAVSLFAPDLWRSLQWAAGYYQRGIGDVLAGALPQWVREGRPVSDAECWGWRRVPGAEARGLKAGGAPARLFERLVAGAVDEAALDLAQPGWRAAARTLAARGLVERVPATRTVQGPRAPAPALTSDQQAAVAAVPLDAGFRAVLLDGVTGSGKTEVYLRLIEQCLAAGRQALVLVPEIGLTPQTLRRFAERLPVPVHSLHSGLPDGERAATWAAFARGEGRVLVGTRSAVFTPLPEGGLIVVDEEHDASFKQQDGFRYSARDFALVRAKALGVPVLLGSATPSLETLQRCAQGRCTRLRLRQRATGAKAPVVEVLDVRRQPLVDGLSPALLEAVGATLARGEQALVFRNRRGFAPVLLCHDCGWGARCSHCEAPMTVHGAGRRLICHHCGARRPAPSACPSCGGLALHAQGAGTERLEAALARAFPDATLVRIDRDTTHGRDAVDRHLSSLGTAPGIVVGTQMLAKGHDLPNLTLVAVTSIDEGLFSVDFRASERLAQLLVQVAGRAGRAQRPGRVLLQTHQPEHPLLLTLLTGGYPAFVELALQERRVARLPPYTHMVLLRVDAREAARGDAFTRAARACLPDSGGAVEAFGPMPAPMPLRAGRHRSQLLLRAEARPALQALLHAWTPRLHALPEARGVRWSLDVDPIDLY